MNDPILASDRAIERGLAHFLTPPEGDFYCEACGSEDCRAPKCALCDEAHECAYSDCGAEEAADAGWTAEQEARAEEHHLEEGRDADRGLE
jgi:hypothetical protein